MGRRAFCLWLRLLDNCQDEWWLHYLPQHFIYEYYDDKILMKLVEHQKRKGGPRASPAFLIFDDCMGDANFNSNVFKIHWNVSPLQLHGLYRNSVHPADSADYQELHDLLLLFQAEIPAFDCCSVGRVCINIFRQKEEVARFPGQVHEKLLCHCSKYGGRGWHQRMFPAHQSSCPITRFAD